MTKQSVKVKTSGAVLRTKSLRGIENCRVVEIGIGNFAECVQQGPSNCSHALPFGYCFLCMHPRVDDIIENTKKAQAVAQVIGQKNSNPASMKG